MADHHLLIGGELQSGASSFPVINPATEEPFSTAPWASRRQLDCAVEAAGDAFKTWRAAPTAERRVALLALAQAVEASGSDLQSLLTQEVGKPSYEAQIEVASAVAVLRYFANAELPVERLASASGATAVVHRKPLGVVAGITPWNMPLLQACVKLGSAIATGNTIILKPAPTTPLSALALGALAAPIFPAGVVNVISDQHDLAPLLTEHPGVAKVGFTGSTTTARKVMAACAPTLKRLTMELGGSDAALVLRDADVKRTARGLFGIAMFNCGQICTAPKRIYVHEDIYDQLTDELCALAHGSVVGEAAAAGTTIGPVQNKSQLDKVVEYLADAHAHGTVLTGGARLDRRGYFVPPTIVRDVTNGCRIVDEEQFGPIMPIVRYEDEDQALALANDSPYGLGGSVWSNDPARARSIAAKLECGQAWINRHGVSPADFPLAGAKLSGVGVELGDEGLKSYTQMTVVCD